MKNILIINTGGTFSSRKGVYGFAPEIKSDEITPRLGILDPTLHVSAEDFCSLDSANFTPATWHDLAEHIGQILPDFDGIVIIHGTDTMGYSASMLSFMLQNVTKPIVLTGSQMPVELPMSDAIENLKCAIYMAASSLAGVFVAFDHKIILGCRASKVRTLSYNAFESINYPYVGEVHALGLRLRKQPVVHRGAFRICTNYSDKVAVLRLFPGLNPEIFCTLQDQGYEGILVEGFGLGGVPFCNKDIVSQIRRSSEAGLPIIVGSQCCYEGSDLTIYETGQRVLECGGIPTHDMTTEAAITKLMWALGQSKKREDVIRIFQTDLAGEVCLP